MSERDAEEPVGTEAPVAEKPAKGGPGAGVVGFILGGAVIVALVVALLVSGAGDDEPQTVAGEDGSSGLSIAPTSGAAGTEVTLKRTCKSGESTVFGWIPPGESAPAVVAVSTGAASSTEVPRLRAATYTLRVTCAGRALGEAPFTVT